MRCTLHTQHTHNTLNTHDKYSSLRCAPGFGKQTRSKKYSLVLTKPKNSNGRASNQTALRTIHTNTSTHTNTHQHTPTHTNTRTHQQTHQHTPTHTPTHTITHTNTHQHKHQHTPSTVRLPCQPRSGGTFGKHTAHTTHTTHIPKKNHFFVPWAAEIKSPPKNDDSSLQNQKIQTAAFQFQR